MNGYKEAGGFNELANLHQRIQRCHGRPLSMACERGTYGFVFSSSIVLARHTGSGGDEIVLDGLLKNCGSYLQALDPLEAHGLGSRLESP
ncbi:MAG: hypothetical protein E5Y67_29520 [Mesorhizobium sp.]|uniref:hypothetical protein n=1 Tax=Mesorhizobium sp. TaxID=1871066 RepID=UPI00120946EC|nr:hypothetical protein [Mesorhizobium sp.]TIM07752.1 MAG: hypothetical protein E5Y67_29520 [Mesorhizobium sp.]